MTKSQMIKTVQQFAKKNGRNPNIRDVMGKTDITLHAIYRRFGSWRKVLAEAGLQPSGPGFGQKDSTLMMDWAAAVRKLKKVPSVTEYERVG